ncbi:MAG: hypothetical protein HY314_12225, partial [Acidobacteria bacterium]|nr:hypothetical protein [Acidobacteriota bacterium]
MIQYLAQPLIRWSRLIVLMLSLASVFGLIASLTSTPVQAAQNDARWVPHNQGIIGANIVGLAIDPMTPTTIYALTNSNGVYKSTDGGVTWVEKNVGLPAHKIVKWGHLFANLLVTDPKNPDTVYIPVQGRIYKSTGGAEHWAESSRGTTFPACGAHGDNIAGILIDPRNSDHLYAGTVASGCSGGLFESMDAGATWRQVAGSNIVGSGLGNDAWALALDPTRPNRLYIGSIKDAFFFSQTGGKSWSSFIPPQAVNSSRVVVVDPASTRRVFLGNGNGLFILMSTTFAVSVVAHVLPGEDIWSIQFVPSNPRIIYIATAAGGLYKSTDGGLQWQHLGHTDTFPQSLAIHPSNPDIIYTGSAGAGTYQSFDGGQTFAARNEGLPFKAQVQTLIRHPQNGNILYAGISANGVYQSLDRGQSWTKMSSDANVANAFHLTINPANPDILYGGDRVIKKSTDGGWTWTEILKPEIAFFRSFALDPNGPDTLFTVDSTNLKMYKSTDGGRTWAIKASYAPSAPVRVAESIVVDPTNSNRVYAASYDFLWKSTNGGETWRRVTRGLESIPLANWIEAITIDPVIPSILYITTRANKVFKSVDFGETWSDTGFVGPLPGRIIVDANDHNTLSVATLTSWFQSADGGRSWVERSAKGLPPGDFFQAKFAGLIPDTLDPGRFYIGTGFSGILVYEVASSYLLLTTEVLQISDEICKTSDCPLGELIIASHS